MPIDKVNQDRPRSAFRHAASKVPEVTVAFWVTKALTTGMGESSSDYLVHRLPPVIAVAIGAIALAIALVLQFAARRYVPWTYWLAVAMVGVFGTMAADVLHVGLGVPYLVSTAFFAVALAVIFGLWYGCEKTLSIHSIHTRRRELSYWAAVMATFALGTAAGDMTAVTFGWGFFVSGVVFTILFAIPLIAGRFGVNEVLTFWAAYILTRPMGASFADWMGMPPERGGLGWGTGLVTVVWALAIVILVAVLAITRSDVDPADRDAPLSHEDDAWVAGFRGTDPT